MPRTLELVETQVSARTQWHFVVFRDDDAVAVGECSDSGAPWELVALLADLAPAVVGHDLVAERASLVETVAGCVPAQRSRSRLAAATLLGGLEQLLVDHS